MKIPKLCSDRSSPKDKDLSQDSNQYLTKVAEEMNHCPKNLWISYTGRSNLYEGKGVK
jgi:IS30 family transposase